MAEFNINCSWQICNDRALKDAVHLIQTPSTQNELKFDLVDEITAERCLNLEKNIDDSQNLEISFSPPHNFEIIKMCTICEARHVELYNHRNEYVITSNSVVINADIDGFAAYRNEIVLVTSLPSCKLKFVSLKQPNSMWLYGIAFHVRKISCEEHSKPESISGIVSKLQEDGLKMSDGAKRLAELLKTNNTSSNNVPAYLSVFMGMINNSKLSTINSLKHLEIKDDDSKPLEDAKENCSINQKPVPLRSDPSNSLKQLVDSAIAQFEDRLWEKIQNHMEMQEERYMKKLDQILACLNK